jgi:hypothetical protein
MGDEQQDNALGRLFQKLQKRVGGGSVHLVGGVDDHGAPAAIGRGEVQEAAEAADGVDGDLRAQAIGRDERGRAGLGGQLAG